MTLSIVIDNDFCLREPQFWQGTGAFLQSLEDIDAWLTSTLMDLEVTEDGGAHDRGAGAGYRSIMTATPQEPTEEPEVVPSGDPSPISTPDPDPEPATEPVDEPTDRG